MTTDTRPWASYARISKRKAGDGAGAHVGISNQHQENQDYIQAVAPGVTVLQFQDNMSAWDPDVTRPAWEDLNQRILVGEFAGVVGWHADRMTRQPLQLEQHLANCKRGQAQLHTTRSGHVTNPTMLRIEGALAANESDQKSARITLKHQQLAADGAFHGGPRRFGYEPGMAAIRESEARWTRWMAKGVLAGRSLYSLAAELRDLGVKTASGGDWRGPNISEYLRRPMLAGLRVHKGEIVGQAQWQPILEVSTWEAVRVLLQNPDRRTSKSQARRYLLSGVARCGVCLGPMRGRSNGTRPNVPPSYMCGLSTAHVSRRADLVDARVRAEVVARLTQVDAAAVLAEPDSSPSERAALQARIDTLQANLRALADEAVLGLITRDMLHSATLTVTREVDALQAQLADLSLVALQPLAVLQGIAGEAEAAAIFDSLDLDRRRAIVDALCVVTIHKATRRGAAFDPSLVQVEWKG